MPPDEEFEERVALDDDTAVEALGALYDLRPPRAAWRADADAAPLGKPVYAREPDSIRVVIAIRDEEGWVCVRRDG